MAHGVTGHTSKWNKDAQRQKNIEVSVDDMLLKQKLTKTYKKCVTSKSLTAARQIKSEDKEMKRKFISVIFLFLFFTSTNAFADSTYNWTGFYVGLEGMYDHGNTKWEYTNNFARADHTINGWMGGLFLGYNYQFPINVVVGVETDINYGKIMVRRALQTQLTWSTPKLIGWVQPVFARAMLFGVFCPT